MLKSQLIDRLAEKLKQLNLDEIDLGVNLMIDAMSDSLSASHRIEIRDFGSFSVHYRPPRQAHNPKTGKKLMTTAKYRPHFKPGKALRDRVNSNFKTTSNHIIQFPNKNGSTDIES